MTKLLVQLTDKITGHAIRLYYSPLDFLRLISVPAGTMFNQVVGTDRYSYEVARRKLVKLIEGSKEDRSA